MDFDQAVAAHSSWKRKLAAYLKERDGSLKASDASSDDKCPLGQWIYGEGGKFVSLPEFSTLKREHARFHKAVGDVIRRANSGQPVSEEMAIGSNSEFTSASSAVVMALVKLKKCAVQ